MIAHSCTVLGGVPTKSHVREFGITARIIVHAAARTAGDVAVKVHAAEDWAAGVVEHASAANGCGSCPVIFKIYIGQRRIAGVVVHTAADIRLIIPQGAPRQIYVAAEIRHPSIRILSRITLKQTKQDLRVAGIVEKPASKICVVVAEGCEQQTRVAVQVIHSTP